MAEHDSAQERTERATPKRQREARRRGQVARSRELTTALVLSVACGFLLLWGERLVGVLAELMRQGLRVAGTGPGQGEAAMTDSLARLGMTALDLFVLWGLVLGLVALLAPMLLGGWTFSTQAIAWQWERLDPWRGCRRMFSWHGLAELAKALIKVLLVAGVAWLVAKHYADDLIGLGRLPTEAALAGAAQLLGWGFFVLCAATVLIAAVDVPYQLWTHARQLRMTRQELREELKETEGRPEVRARLRRLQQERARRRMMAEVPRATVVVTNPTHYAVALRYVPPKTRAPVVVAKGTDRLAERIRELARASNVPILPAPPLARALYYGARLGQEIPTELYTAVARVLAYVYRLQAGRRHGEPPPAPPRAEELEIPPALRRD